MGLDVRERRRQDLIGVAAVGADAGNRKLGELPAVALAHLGRGDLEFRSDAPKQAADHLALALERTAVRYVQNDPKQTDGKGR